MDYCNASNQIGSFVPSSGTLTQNIITKNVDCVSLEADLVSCDTLTIKGVEYPQSIDSVISATQHQSAVTNPYALTSFASSLSASEVTTPGQITTNTINPYGSTPTITLGSTKPGLVVNNTTGYVGIGTSTPSTFLDITGTSTSPGTTIRSIFPLTASGSTRILLGASSSITRDAGFIDYVYTSSGSTSNQIRMGLLNQTTPMIIISGTATTISGDVNIDSNTFKLDSVNNRVGINNSTPVQALDVVGSIVATGSITGNTIAGTISTAVQPNITQVGSLSTLVVVGETNIDSNTLRVSAALNRVGIVNPTPTEALDVNGNILASGSITGATLAGTISTADQPNITSTGTLTSLTVTGDTNIDSNTLKVDSTTNRVGVVNSTPTEALDVTGNIKASGSITGATLSGTISTAAQPNITSTGTLTSLTVSGNTTLNGPLTLTKPTNTPDPLIYPMNAFTSGSYHTLTGITSDAKEIIVSFEDVGLSSNGQFGIIVENATVMQGVSNYGAFNEVGAADRATDRVPVTCSGLRNSECVRGFVFIRKVFRTSTTWVWAVNGSVYMNGGADGVGNSCTPTIGGLITNATNNLNITKIGYKVAYVSGNFNRAGSVVNYNWNN